jgi:hypothetical protein
MIQTPIESRLCKYAKKARQTSMLTGDGKILARGLIKCAEMDLENVAGFIGASFEPSATWYLVNAMTALDAVIGKVAVANGLSVADVLDRVRTLIPGFAALRVLMLEYDAPGTADLGRYRIFAPRSQG